MIDGQREKMTMAERRTSQGFAWFQQRSSGRFSPEHEKGMTGYVLHHSFFKRNQIAACHAVAPHHPVFALLREGGEERSPPA